MIALYGIKNCDTMKKARVWLDEHHVAYEFHDYKVEGADRARVLRWIAVAGWDVVLNRVGTTFRKLPDDVKVGIDEARAVELMLEQPSMIKRPVLEYPGGILVGFKPEQYARVLL